MGKRKFYRVYMTKKSCCYYLLNLHSCTCWNAHFALPSWVLPVFFFTKNPTEQVTGGSLTTRGLAKLLNSSIRYS